METSSTKSGMVWRFNTFISLRRRLCSLLRIVIPAFIFLFLFLYLLFVFWNPCNANFFSFWHGTEELREEHLRTLETFFYHHPKCHLKIFSNTLSMDSLKKFTELGYYASVERYDLEKMSSIAPGSTFLSALRSTHNEY